MLLLLRPRVFFVVSPCPVLTPRSPGTLVLTGQGGYGGGTYGGGYYDGSGSLILTAVTSPGVRILTPVTPGLAIFPSTTTFPTTTLYPSTAPASFLVLSPSALTVVQANAGILSLSQVAPSMAVFPSTTTFPGTSLYPSAAPTLGLPSPGSLTLTGLGEYGDGTYGGGAYNGSTLLSLTAIPAGTAIFPSALTFPGTGTFPTAAPSIFTDAPGSLSLTPEQPC